ncbi:MAG: glutamyl-tRNA reductase [Thermodesulfobacteriota bacterium]|nr:glutamyl-tRNA reductase [Thermodesulfobacteriota bacterium]
MLSVLTINHNNTEISFLENFAFNKDNLHLALGGLIDKRGIDECFILSTCNRIEIYVYSKIENIESTIIQFVSDFHKLQIEKSPITYQFMHDKDAIYHLFKVASGSDSMIIGEPQIVNQIKESYRIANSVGTIGTFLHKLVHMSLFTAKKVRSETSINNKGNSVGSLVIKLSKKIFDNLKNRSVLIIGTGEMSQLLVSHLKAEGLSNIFVASRDLKNAITFGDRYSCKPVILENIDNYLSEADIVFSSSGSQNFLITKESIEKVLQTRTKHNIFFIDIAVPRDIDPRVGDIDKCFLYNLDDLKSIISDDLIENNKSLEEASEIIQDSVGSYTHWENVNNSKDIIKGLREHVYEVVSSEIGENKNKLDTEALSRKISNKILHSPVNKIKAESEMQESLYLKVLSDIFDSKKRETKDNLLKLGNESRHKNRD